MPALWFWEHHLISPCFGVLMSEMGYLLHKVGVRLTEKLYSVASIALLPRPFSGFHLAPAAHSTFTPFIKTLQCQLCASLCAGCYKSDTAPAPRHLGRGRSGAEGRKSFTHLSLDFIFLKLITMFLLADGGRKGGNAY